MFVGLAGILGLLFNGMFVGQNTLVGTLGFPLFRHFDINNVGIWGRVGEGNIQRSISWDSETLTSARNVRTKVLNSVPYKSGPFYME